MIITRTPFRMSFFGGGTDFPDFYNEYGGSVISTTIDKYCYVNVRHLPSFFDYTDQIIYSKIEEVTDIGDIRHPMVREAMKLLNMHNLRIAYDADLPARSGLGTSSSFAVGLLNAFHALKGHYTDKRKLADEAIYLERVLCGEAGGIQDQVAAAFGNLNRIDFSYDGYHVSPVIISGEKKRQLNESLLLFFTGFSRLSSSIQESTQKELKNKTAELKEMKALVDEAEKVLTDRRDSLRESGRLLHHSWQLKRGISKGISTDSIDVLYDRARKAGALGGKILGAGGGGFLLFYVEREYRQAVIDELKPLLYVPFGFDTTEAQILFFSPEDEKGKETAL